MKRLGGDQRRQLLTKDKAAPPIAANFAKPAQPSRKPQ
jgi:hypothetical protein